MDPKKAFKYCLLCGSIAKPNDQYIECTNCGYRFFINPAPCNAAIIENENGEILLVERKFDPKKGYWDVPGGFIQADESLEESTKREIREELGVDMQINKIIGVYEDTYLFQDIIVPTLGVIVSAKIVKGTLQPSDDITSFKFFPKKDVLKQKLAFESVRKGLTDYLKSSNK